MTQPRTTGACLRAGAGVHADRFCTDGTGKVVNFRGGVAFLARTRTPVCDLVPRNMRAAAMCRGA